jgi:hypothetical protein
MQFAASELRLAIRELEPESIPYRERIRTLDDERNEFRSTLTTLDDPLQCAIMRATTQARV